MSYSDHYSDDFSEEEHEYSDGMEDQLPVRSFAWEINDFGVRIGQELTEIAAIKDQIMELENMSIFDLFIMRIRQFFGS